MSVRKSTKDRRVEIEGATLALARKHGPEQVTTTMIADLLSMTQPALYKHFPSKTDLWQSIYRSLGARIAENVTNAQAPEKTPLEQLRLLIRGQLQLLHDTPALPDIMVMRDKTDTQGAIRREIHTNMAGFQNAMVAMIEQAQKDGALRSSIAPNDIATLLMGLIQSLVLKSMVTRDQGVLLRDTDRLLDLQLTAFAPQGVQE